MRSLGSRFRGYGIKSRILNPYDAFWDQKLGIKTFGFYPARGQEGDRDWQTHYVPTTYYDLFRLFRMVNLGRDDIFVDLGSGLGRPVFAASWFGAKSAVGVEVCARSLRCRDRKLQPEWACRQEHSIRLRERHGLSAGRHDRAVHVSPFRRAHVAHRAAKPGVCAQAARHRPLRIIYGNPICDFVMKESGWLECIARVPPPRLRMSTASRYVTSLWHSLPGR